MTCKIPKWLYKILRIFNLVEYADHFDNCRVLELEIRRDDPYHPNDNIYYYKIKLENKYDIISYTTAIRKFEVGDFLHLSWEDSVNSVI